MGKKTTCPRYVNDITGTGLLCLGELGGMINSEKLEKMRHFQLTKECRILMKFEVWKDIVSKSSYFKSQLYLVTLGGIEGGT